MNSIKKSLFCIIDVKSDFNMAKNKVELTGLNTNNSDDLLQIGVIGLIKAIDNFNIDLGLKLSTYAIPIVFD